VQAEPVANEQETAIMNSLAQRRRKAVRRVLLLIALTAGLSLLYAVQDTLGGPLGLTVVSEIHDLDLNPGGSLVAAGAEDATVRLWEIPRAQEARKRDAWAMRELVGHTGPVVGVDFDPSGSALFSASRDGTVRIWDVASDQAETVLDVPGGQSLNDASLSADGLTYATVSEEGFVYAWDVAEVRAAGSASPTQSIGPDENTKNAVALSPDGSLVAADDGSDIQIWDTRTGEPVQHLEGYWEDEATREDWLGHTGEVTALAFSPDGMVLASGGTDKDIVFWDVETGEVTWSGKGHFAAITTLVFNDEGDAVMSGSVDTKAKIWRVPGAKVTATFVGHLSTVKGVDFGPGQDNVLTGGDDGTLRLWDVVNTTKIHIEWTAEGLQPVWGEIFNIWMPFSGLIGLVCAWGLWQARRFSHLLALALYILGSILVLGPPLVETYFYPFSLGVRLQIAMPLLVLAAWYTLLVWILLRGSVAAFYEAPQDAPLAEQLMASQRTRQLRNGLYIAAVWFALLVLLFSVLRQFNLDIALMRNFLPFIMTGAGYTVLVSAASIALAVVLALLGALGRLSRNPIANGVSGFYISLIRGTPLLVQIYIWYLGLPRLDIILSPLVAGILALSVNYGAYMTEIFRAGIQAIGIGQHEAAQALGMSRTQTLRRIVLPQAFRIVIPPIGNEFIAMMKDSSLVSVITVWELTFRANKIGRQYFRGLETFIVAATFYWVLTVIFQSLQGKLETHMARGERR
jgi:polar amino acid transport system permease protein